MHPVRTAARAMLAGVFVVEGAEVLANPDPLVNRARKVTDQVAPALRNVHPNLATDTRTLVKANAAVMVTGAALLLTPLRRPAALALAAAMVPTTLAGHAYWEQSDTGLRRQDRIQFLKNLGLVGGLLLAAIDTQGRPGLRWRAGHLVGTANRSLHREARNTGKRVRAVTAGTVIGRGMARK